MKTLGILLTGVVILFSYILAYTAVSTHLPFHYDMARDGFEAYAIWHNHDIKILGPSSDVPGLNHGVLWYYVIAVPYFFAQGNPEILAETMTTFYYLLIPVFGYIAYKITKNTEIACISIALYALAPLVVSFSFWLSNPQLALCITPFLLWSLWNYVHSKTWKTALMIGIGFGLLMQSDFAFIVTLLTIPVYFWIFKLKLSVVNGIAFFAGFSVTTATLLVSYIKFKTNIFSIVFHFLVNNTGSDFSTGSSLLQLLDNVVNLFAMTFFPIPKFLLFGLLLYVIISQRNTLVKMKEVVFLGIWVIVSFLALFTFNRGSFIFFFAGPLLFPTAILVAITIQHYFKNRVVKYSFITFLLIFQLLLINSWSKNEVTPLVIQSGMTFQKEKQVVDYTYQAAGKKPFIIKAITTPLFIATTWAYVYEFYGKPTYGYVPYWGGPAQTGRLGNLPRKEFGEEMRFLIIEPKGGVPDIWITKILYEEDILSDIVEEKKFGNFTVQKRVFNPKGPDFVIPSALLEKPELLKY